MAIFFLNSHLEQCALLCSVLNEILKLQWLQSVPDCVFILFHWDGGSYNWVFVSSVKDVRLKVLEMDVFRQHLSLGTWLSLLTRFLLCCTAGGSLWVCTNCWNSSACKIMLTFGELSQVTHLSTYFRGKRILWLIAAAFAQTSICFSTYF